MYMSHGMKLAVNSPNAFTIIRSASRQGSGECPESLAEPISTILDVLES